ncbi:magnesium transporter [Chelatococcus sp. SYSU_G07232]|uniref:Magnesium transporter MgtE n=1 Tax=Chelatococcus albus TaxID=3047466 RepID=A0ABT7AE35_9HYPH|nr:magnesium transporter [Chelatococcus sp. SYSU_G07232]MDJ1157237.1 magnesium transporter [Chelatococcus sp. SYSU_G07232]
MQDVENQTAPEVPAFRDDGGNVSGAFAALVSQAVTTGDAASLRALVSDLHEADVGALIEALDSGERPRFIELLGEDFDFTALTEVDDAVREEILEEIPNEEIAEGVRDLEVDDAVYILEDLDEEDKAEVLDRLPALERVALQRSLEYPEDSAGRRMQTQFIAVPPFWSVGQTIDYMRETEDLPDTFYEIFVIDPGYHLIGTVPLDKLLRSKRPMKIGDIMSEDQHLIRATDDQEEAARLFQRYNLVSCAVVDVSNRLVGVMMVDDIVDVIEEEADEDLKALGGVKGDEELSDTVLYTVKSRFPWLFANLITAVLAATVIAFFEHSIERMVALAVLMPIVASMGGNAGTQTMTVTVRALATKELHRSNAWRVIRRELAVGATNGLAFALILGSVAVGWFGIRDLGIVIGMAILTVLTTAALGGILIPLLLSRFGVDPAVSSGPFVTTITDVVGFFSFLGIATLWFGLS